MKHKYSFFLAFFGWFSIVVGLLLALSSLFGRTSETNERFYFAFSLIFIGIVYFIINYVIQMVFEGVNHLKEINSKFVNLRTGSENQSVENIKSGYSSLEPLPIYTKFETKKVDVKIENEFSNSINVYNKKDWFVVAVLIIVIIYVVMVVTGLLK